MSKTAARHRVLLSRGEGGSPEARGGRMSLDALLRGVAPGGALLWTPPAEEWAVHGQRADGRWPGAGGRGDGK